MKVQVGAFNQAKPLLNAFSVIVKTSPMVHLQLYDFTVRDPNTSARGVIVIFRE